MLCALISCGHKDGGNDDSIPATEHEISNQVTHDEDAAKQDNALAETSESGAGELLLHAYAVPTAHLEMQAGNNYDASNLTDGNFGTAWAIDLDMPGVIDADVVDYLSFKLHARKITRIVIANGYGKNSKAYHNNTRARMVFISRVPWEEAEDSDILFSGEIKDTMSPQSIPVSKTFDNSRPTNTVYVMFGNDFYPGQKYNDLCISEIQFFGTEVRN